MSFLPISWRCLQCQNAWISSEFRYAAVGHVTLLNSSSPTSRAGGYPAAQPG